MKGHDVNRADHSLAREHDQQRFREGSHQMRVEQSISDHLSGAIPDVDGEQVRIELRRGNALDPLSLFWCQEDVAALDSVGVRESQSGYLVTGVENGSVHPGRARHQAQQEGGTEAADRGQPGEPLAVVEEVGAGHFDYDSQIRLLDARLPRKRGVSPLAKGVAPRRIGMAAARSVFRPMTSREALAACTSVVLHAALLWGISAGYVLRSQPPLPMEPLLVFLGPPGPAGGLGGVGTTGGVPGARAETVEVENPPAPVATPPPPQPEVAKVEKPVAAAVRPAPPKPTAAPTLRDELAPQTTETARPTAPPTRGGSIGSPAVGAGSRGPAGGAGGAGTGGRGGTASYEQVIAAWLDRHKYYPANLRRRGIEGEGKLKIRISRSGQLLAVDVASPFSHPALAAISEEWVRRAEPFPPAPDSLRGDDFEFLVPVGFRLR